MLKVALAAAVAGMAVASMAQVGGARVAAEAPPVALPACHSVQSTNLDCAVRILDANGDGTVSAAELASFAAPASSPAADWAPVPPQRSGLDFKDAAAEAAPSMAGALDVRSPPTLLSALLALGAMVVLLRRRPG